MKISDHSQEIVLRNEVLEKIHISQVENLYNLSDKERSEVSSICASWPALPLVPSKKPAPLVDLEGTDSTKDGCVTSRQSSHRLAPFVARLKEQLGLSDSVFKDTETFEDTRIERLYSGDMSGWSPCWVTSKMRRQRYPFVARGWSRTKRITRK